MSEADRGPTPSRVESSEGEARTAEAADLAERTEEGRRRFDRVSEAGETGLGQYEAGAEEALREKSSLAISDDGFDLLGHIIQDAADSDISNGGVIAERYVQGELEVVLRIRPDDAALYDHVFFKRSPLNGDALLFAGDRGGYFAGRGCYRKQCSVFVSHVEKMERMEEVVPSEVRFQLGDPSDSVSVKHLYFSLPTGVCKVIKTLTEWKLDEPNIYSGVDFECEDAGQHIQRGTEIVEGVARAEGHVVGDFMRLRNLHKFVDSIRIGLDRDGVRLDAIEGHYREPGFVEVLLGPLDL